jgi:hypothetical protein
MRPLVLLVATLLAVGFGAALSQTSICDVQEYDYQGLSPLVGQWVSVRGSVTCPPGYIQPYYTNFFIESGGCGVNVFSYDWPPMDLALGDSVEVSGEVVEYISSTTGAGATTEIFTSESGMALISSGHPAPVPTELTCAEVNREENEGRLLCTSGVVVDLELPYSFYIDDGTDVVEVYRAAPDSVDFSWVNYGDRLCVTGVLGQYDRTPPYLEDYELMPRTSRDIRECTPVAVREMSWGTVKATFRGAGPHN